jgi:hypothetical protein
MHIMRYATVADLRDSGDDVAALVAAREVPIPQLPIDPEKRASKLLVMLLESRDRERRWQALTFPEV